MNFNQIFILKQHVGTWGRWPPPPNTMNFQPYDINTWIPKSSISVQVILLGDLNGSNMSTELIRYRVITLWWTVCGIKKMKIWSHTKHIFKILLVWRMVLLLRDVENMQFKYFKGNYKTTELCFYVFKNHISSILKCISSCNLVCPLFFTLSWQEYDNSNYKS